MLLSHPIALCSLLLLLLSNNSNTLVQCFTSPLLKFQSRRQQEQLFVSPSQQNSDGGFTRRFDNDDADNNDDAIDAQFETQLENHDDEDEKEEFYEANQEPALPDPLTFGKKTWIDLALESNKDEELSGAVPFITRNDQVIECKLAFSVELNNNNKGATITYGLGVPVNPVVVIVIQDRDGNLDCIDPDLDENLELMEIMAGALKKHYGQELNIRRTPKYLTVEGGLEKYTDNWVDNVFGIPEQDFDDVFDGFYNQEDENMEFFNKHMKELIGEEKFDKVMKEAQLIKENDDEEDNVDDFDFNLQEMFDLLPNDFENKQQMMDLINNFDGDNIDDAQEMIRNLNSNLFQQDSAIRLLGCKFKDGNEYILAKPIRPVIVVGRRVDVGHGVQFHLLTKQEEQTIMPRLDAQIKEEFDQLQQEQQDNKEENEQEEEIN